MAVLFVVACGARKRPHPAPARELYTGQHFRYVLETAQAEAAATVDDLGVDARVMILSAKYGLVAPGRVLDPYDVTFGDPDAVSLLDLQVQAVELGLGRDDEVYALLPARYRVVLASAFTVLGVPVHDVYEAAPGIGYQRGVCAALRRSGRRALVHG